MEKKITAEVLDDLIESAKALLGKGVCCNISLSPERDYCGCHYDGEVDIHIMHHKEEALAVVANDICDEHRYVRNIHHIAMRNGVRIAVLTDAPEVEEDAEA